MKSEEGKKLFSLFIKFLFEQRGVPDTKDL
jgi:hypothetical protein